MNLAQSTSLHSHLRDEEALVVENAIRLAVDSILNVLYGVNSSRSREYQRMVADRDKEIQRLEGRLREMEREAHTLRRCGGGGCACTLLSGSEREQVISSATGERQAAEERAEGGDTEPEVGEQEQQQQQQHCELSLSLGLFANPPSHVPPLSQEASASLPFAPVSRLVPELDSADPSGVSEDSRKSPSASSSGVAVKEEPCDIDSVLIKWEMSEERFREHQERDSGLCWDEDQLERMDGMNYGEVDSVAHQMTEAEQLRNRKKRVSMAELSEEAQRLKRAAWRAASRRYYARKVARQQSLLARPGPFHHQTAPHYAASTSSSHCLAFGNKKKRAPISTLPQESQAQQREAWRASSKRYYYARKMALHQTEPSQYPLQHIEPPEPPGEAQDEVNSYADSGGLGGIMCS
uniref:uncharacterized protein LOC131105685 n=1 Tax=Doryrhamphus excisus TaxID=161450 RepID=UPI0025ADE233|nr:uncharacterized protein LOC131105685 [Doryrhamphus excisus]